MFTERYYKQYKLNNIREFARGTLNLSPKVKALFSRVQNLPPKAQVLDAGCGEGGLLELIEKQNPKVVTTGVDIGTPPKFRAKGHFINADIRSLPFDDQTFDLVTCSHVIEHVLNPFEVLTELYRVCKPNGFIYVEAPSHRSTLLPFGFNFWDDPTHIRPYTTTSLERLLFQTGFKPARKGIKHSVSALIFGLPYMIYGAFKNDEQARSLFPAYLFGFYIYAIGEK